MAPIQKNTCSRQCAQLDGGLFVGENSSLRASDDALMILDKIVPSQSGFVLATMNKLFQYGNVHGKKFDLMPDGYFKAPRKASGIEAWEDVGVLIVDTLYPDYWRSWPTYKDVWDAYERAGDKILSVPSRVVEINKMSVIFNACAYAIEQRSDGTGYPLGLNNVVRALTFKAYESTCYGLAEMYTYGRGLQCKPEDLVFAGFLTILCHDVCEYVRDCYEENYGSTCMILHGLGEDGFQIGCAILFSVWNSLDSFEEKMARLLRHSISTSVVGNLVVPRYSGKERLMECTSGEWSAKVKAASVELVQEMTGVSIAWPENVPLAAISDAACADYHRTAVIALLESTSDQMADMCVEWANEIINSTVMREKTVLYTNRVSVQRGDWA
ncbi:unnamed protein product [Mortierella alpina]